MVWATACFALLDRTEIQPGSKLLVQGGTGGVGFAAVQLAAAKLDVEVYTTCGSDEKCKIAEDLGAKKAFNYNTVSTEDMVAEVTDGNGFEVIFNAPGEATINASVAAGGFGTKIIDINGTFPTGPSAFQLKQMEFLSVFAGHPIVLGFDEEKIGTFLTLLTELAEAGKVKPLVDEKRFTFATIGEAHTYQETSGPTGKVAVSATWE